MSREEVQGANLRAAQPSPRAEVYASNRRCTVIWIPRLPLLLPPQSSSHEAERYTMGEGPSHRSRQVGITFEDSQRHSGDRSQCVQASRCEDARR